MSYKTAGEAMSDEFPAHQLNALVAMPGSVVKRIVISATHYPDLTLPMPLITYAPSLTVI